MRETSNHKVRSVNYIIFVIYTCLKTRLFNLCHTNNDIRCEARTLTKETMYRIRVVRGAMERAMLGITLPDRIRDMEIRC